MASEDNFLRLDANNYDDEMISHLGNGDINSQDLLDFLSEGYISAQQFVKYLSYANDYIED